MMALIVAQGAAILLLGLLVAGLLRSHAEILRRLHDLGSEAERPHPEPEARSSLALATAPPGSSSQPADVAGTSLDGGALTLAVTGTSHRTLLAFLSTGCGSCLPFWETFADPERSLLGNDVRVVIVAKGPEAESESRLHELAPPDVPLVLSSRAWENYRVPVSPYFVLVDGPTGAILGEGSAPAWSQVVSLLEQAAADADLATRRRGRRPDREARADRELLAAGIHPGHPSLYPDRDPEDRPHA